ncbi:glycosyltransferase family 2 protein [Bacteroides sp.]
MSSNMLFKHDNPLVSIIINFYNGEQYLANAINSVLNQTYKNLELVLYDNVSADNSALIVQQYKDERIRYALADEHTSLGEARNRALKIAKGDFISFLDCDDWIERDKVEISLTHFSQDAVGLVYTNGYTFYEKKKQYKKFFNEKQKEGWIFEDLLASYRIAIPSVMFRRSVIEKLPSWFDTRFSMIEEFDLFIRIAQISEIRYDERCLCYWRAHDTSMTWSKRTCFEVEMKLFLERLLKENPALADHYSIKRYRAKIAFHHFMNTWSKQFKPDRGSLVDFLFVDKRLMLIYLVSFLGKNQFYKILKFFNIYV